jgi:4-diphosphocytidyl-2-C-methyl-D-erythritol kinase
MKVYANAKINIGLNIVEKRADNYHNIESLFYPVHFLYDDLEILPSHALEKGHAVLTDAGIQTEADQNNNLVMKAFHKLSGLFEIPGSEIRLIKNIPVGAGLGGGSSDAAFTIKVLNELYDLHLSDFQMEAILAELGADCPFFVKNAPVFATGTGNVFTQFDAVLKSKWLLLVKPDIHVSTKMAYAGVVPAKPVRNLMQDLTLALNQWKDLVKNDFEVSVFQQFPLIGQLKDSMYENRAIYASMSGSGSSVYGIFEQDPVELLKTFENYQAFSGQLQ